MNKFMQKAIEEAYDGVRRGHSSPFGAVVVKNGKIIGKGHNKVLKDCDPTCHGEIVAIRNACKRLKTYDLSNCELYTTGEPCDMCLCACLWANIKKVYYGATIKDNSKLGFRDEKFDKIFGQRKKLKNYLVNIDREACLKLFSEYDKKDKIIY